jgi:hypothetical protein
MEEEQGALSSEDEVEEEEAESMTRERFLERVNGATNGMHLLELLTFLPNTAQRWGHSITMNAIIKILCRSPIFKEQCESFYAVKVKKGVETKVPSTFIGLSPALQSAVFNVVSQLTPTHGPWDQVTQLLRHCEGHPGKQMQRLQVNCNHLRA